MRLSIILLFTTLTGCASLDSPPVVYCEPNPVYQAPTPVTEASDSPVDIEAPTTAPKNVETQETPEPAGGGCNQGVS
jgi:hypothetical protein